MGFKQEHPLTENNAYEIRKNARTIIIPILVYDVEKEEEQYRNSDLLNKQPEKIIPDIAQLVVRCDAVESYWKDTVVGNELTLSLKSGKIYVCPYSLELEAILYKVINNEYNTYTKPAWNQK